MLAVLLFLCIAVGDHTYSSLESAPKIMQNSKQLAITEHFLILGPC